MDDDDKATCIEEGSNCKGPVEFHSYGGRMKAFPRCEAHHETRLAAERGIQERYPVHAPSDFSGSDAGEQWEEDL
jgi:hypothetical protein